MNYRGLVKLNNSLRELLQIRESFCTLNIFFLWKGFISDYADFWGYV